MLEIKNLTVKVGGKVILRDVSFEFKTGKSYAIMGPNGSGKSTLAKVIMGHPDYKVVAGKVIYNSQDITELEPHKRAKLGLFLGFQNPLELSGVSVVELLQAALSGKKRILEIRREVNKMTGELKMRNELISRSLNMGASGGERKKLELLQAVVLDPKVAIFDEIDTGVDVDALRIIAGLLNKVFVHRVGKILILITHYNRILDYVVPDQVLVMMGGKIVKVGPAHLAREIEKKGYKKINF